MKRAWRGTTLVETLVATAVFVTFSVALYQLYGKLVELSSNIRTRIVATQLANEQFEIIRNLQYYDVGTVGGIPSGAIAQNQTLSRNNTDFSVNTTIRNIDHPADGTLGGTPNDLSPADNKLVEITITCITCKTPVSVSYTSWIAPKSLETENGNGALVVKAINANGEPIAQASVTIINNTISPPVSITEVTDANGVLTIVDAPPATESYEIIVTKNGYSTERTYPPTGGSDPTKPHLTVLAGQVTQATFSIDQISSIVLETKDATCAPVGGVSGSFTGAKQTNTIPPVTKNVYSFTTNAQGTTNISSIEWDTYLATITGSTLDLIGINPLQPLNIPAGTTQNVSLIVRPKNPHTVLTTVTDVSTGLPLANASVTITGDALTQTKTTNIGSLTQTDWSDGGGQELYSDKEKFFSADAGIDYNTVSGQLTLTSVGGTYVESGILTSSTFDVGAAANFRQLTWSPVSQPVGSGATPIRFQIATNTDNATWNFVGPDGTADTYFTTPLTEIGSTHNGDRYLRYKVFLTTTDTEATPRITDISFTYTSGCLPPGQIDFGGLPVGTYTITVSKDGYATEEKTVTINGNESISFSLPAS